MGADYPRVTHPCATLLGAEAPFACDLHVLSTLPAFNLSQNQTLQFEFLARPRHRPETLNLKDFPSLRYSLVNEPGVPPEPDSLYKPASFPRQGLARKIFFAFPTGGGLYKPRRTACQGQPEKFFPAPRRGALI